MGVIIELVTHLLEEIWFWSNPKQADTHWEEDLLKTVNPKTLDNLDVRQLSGIDIITNNAEKPT